MNSISILFNPSCWPLCTVRAFISVLLVLVYCTVLNSLKGTINLNPSILGSSWNLKPGVMEDFILKLDHKFVISNGMRTFTCSSHLGLVTHVTPTNYNIQLSFHI